MIEKRPICGCAGYYVDKTGHVYSGPKLTRKGERKLKPDIDKDGYHVYRLYVNGACVAVKSHRVVLEAFIQPCPRGMVARHLNGDPGDNRLENLCWGTLEENSSDKLIHGTMQRGERNGKTHLLLEEVLGIRSGFNHGTSRTRLSKIYGISYSSVQHIINRRTWKHV